MEGEVEVPDPEDNVITHPMETHLSHQNLWSNRLAIRNMCHMFKILDEAIEVDHPWNWTIHYSVHSANESVGRLGRCHRTTFNVYNEKMGNILHGSNEFPSTNYHKAY